MTDPDAAFDEMTKRSIQPDIEYLRLHVAPSYYEAVRRAGGAESDDAALGMLSNQLALSRCIAAAEPDADGRVRITAVGIAPGLVSGSMVEYHIDLVPHPRHGWQIAGAPYDTKPWRPQRSGM